jgi:hypothetical protein
VQAPNPLVVLTDWVEGPSHDRRRASKRTYHQAQVLRLPACAFGPSGQTNEFESNSEADEVRWRSRECDLVSLNFGRFLATNNQFWIYNAV